MAEGRASEQETGGKTLSLNEACTFICCRDTLDGAYPSLILAINARRQGMEASIFYTFMGINLIRKDRAGSCEFFPAGTMGAIPGMSSVATWMMKRQIDQAGIPAAEEFLEMAQYLSVFLPGARLGR